MRSAGSIGLVLGKLMQCDATCMYSVLASG